MGLIHPSQYPQWRRALIAIGVFVAIFVGTLLLPPLKQFSQLESYVPVHLIFEMLAVVIACLIFAVGWSHRNVEQPRSMAPLAIIFLGVAIFDFSHALSYLGMPDYVTPAGVEKAIWFWLAARTMSLFAFIAYALFSARQYAPSQLYSLLAVVLSTVVIIHMLVFWFPQELPRTFIEGEGLTPFKVGFEYILIIGFIAVAAIFVRQLRKPTRIGASGLVLALVVMALSESYFTLYSSVSDMFNFAGHVYKVVAYWVLYQVLFIQAIRYPYAQLEQSERQLEATLDALPDVFLELNEQDICIAAHTYDHQTFQIRAPEIIGHHPREYLSGANLELVEQAMARARAQGTVGGVQIEMVVSGVLQWYELSISTVKKDFEVHLLVLIRNISEAKQQQLALENFFDANLDLFCIVSAEDGRFIRLNQEWETVLGYSLTELEGHSYREFVHPDDTVETDAEHQRVLDNRGLKKFSNRYRRKDGQYIELEWRSKRLGETIYASARDVTERNEAIREVERLSSYDSLTGLPNQALMQREFEGLVSKRNQHKEKRPIALFWLDLDHFKTINDALGHHIGDSVIRLLAERLRLTLNHDAIVGRQSGDSFVLLIDHADQERLTLTIQRVMEQFAKPFRTYEHNLNASVSVGISIYPDDAHSFEQLLQHAESAMYEVKRSGRNNYRFYSAEMQERSARALQLSVNLRQALLTEQLFLMYQPQYRITDGKLVGVEVLVRWQHPQFGLVSPGEFIPLAEGLGLAQELDLWVLKNALPIAAKIHSLGEVVVSINVSAQHFADPNLSADIQALLQQHKLAPELIEIEITEVAAMRNAEIAADVIEQLRNVGVRVAIDDFGTGYSSLSYLSQFNANTLKIDRAFVDHIDENVANQNIVQSIVELAHRLNMHVLAEGVERTEELAWLKQMKADTYQGYLGDKPLSFEDLLQRIDTKLKP